MKSIRVLLVMALAMVGSGRLTAQDKDADAPKAIPAEKVPWISLFDGKSLKGWEVVKGYDYEEKGKVDVQDGCLVIGTGQPATGVRWTEKFPKVNYEIELEGKRVDGNDFFCGMSFPVGDGALTLILGGWGGSVVGLSCVDGSRAAENETGTYREFKNDQWYRIRVQVTQQKVSAYLDDKYLCGIETRHRKLAVTSEMEPCLPFGFATWSTTGALRNIRYRELKMDVDNKKQDP